MEQGNARYRGTARLNFCMKIGDKGGEFHGEKMEGVRLKKNIDRIKGGGLKIGNAKT